MNELDLDKWRACAPLLPDGGCEAVRELCDELEATRTKRDTALTRLERAERERDEARLECERWAKAHDDNLNRWIDDQDSARSRYDAVATQRDAAVAEWDEARRLAGIIDWAHDVRLSANIARDRDAYKEQHDNALASWDVDRRNLAAKIAGLESTYTELTRMLHSAEVDYKTADADRSELKQQVWQLDGERACWKEHAESSERQLAEVRAERDMMTAIVGWAKELRDVDDIDAGMGGGLAPKSTLTRTALCSLYDAVDAHTEARAARGSKGE